MGGGGQELMDVGSVDTKEEDVGLKVIIMPFKLHYVQSYFFQL